MPPSFRKSRFQYFGESFWSEGSAAPLAKKMSVEAVAVVIERRHAAGHGLDEMLFGRGAVFDREVQACRTGNVAETDRSNGGRSLRACALRPTQYRRARRDSCQRQSLQ